jgi:O-antigen/teichoic acid export membrane protein
MSQIRRQSIISTGLIYIGIAIGFINTLLFTKNGWFTPDQYGLTRSFFDFSQIIYAFTFLGLTAVMYKFTPYYNAHVKAKENDLLSWVLLLCFLSFLIFVGGFYIFKDFFDRKFNAKSALLVKYSFWLIPFSFSVLFFNILETYCWTLKRTIITNFLKETVLRVLTSGLVFLFILGYINFDLFIKLFSFLFFALAIILFFYLKIKKELNFTLKPSLVTKKFLKKMLIFGSFYFAGVVISSVAAGLDSFTISSLIGQDDLGVYAFSTYLTNIIIIPQRSIISISIPILSESWREKKIDKIKMIYQRSSINMLIASLFFFGNIWLCFDEIVPVLNLNPLYNTGKYVVLLFGIKAIIDMSTGVNGQIIATSNYWKFEFFTGIILLSTIAPLSYILIKKMGIEGAALSNLIAYTIYNLIRMAFLWKKLKILPFTNKTIYVLLVSILLYGMVDLITINLHGWIAIFISTILFSSTFIFATFYFNFSPDFKPVLQTIKKRLGFNKK